MKTWLMEGSAYAEDGRIWYTGDKINDDDIEVVKADLARSLADALGDVILCYAACINVAGGQIEENRSIANAKAALSNYRKGAE